MKRQRQPNYDTGAPNDARALLEIMAVMERRNVHADYSSDGGMRRKRILRGLVAFYGLTVNDVFPAHRDAGERG